MLKLLFIVAVFVTTTFATEANTTIVANATKDSNKTIDTNTTKKLNTTADSNKSAIDKNLQKAIENEKKFEQEQKFYMGDDYNLSEHKVDKATVDKVPLIEPEYDFDITDVYAD